MVREFVKRVSILLWGFALVVIHLVLFLCLPVQEGRDISVTIVIAIT